MLEDSEVQKVLFEKWGMQKIRIVPNQLFFGQGYMQLPGSLEHYILLLGRIIGDNGKFGDENAYLVTGWRSMPEEY